MTRRKLITLKVIRQWEPIVAACVDGLLKEPARTNGQGARAKIRLKFPVSYVPPKKFPKFLWVACEEEGFCIREWRCVTLLQWLYDLKISQWTANDIYKKRMSILSSMRTLEKELDICDVEE